MTESSEPMLRVAPFFAGRATRGRVVLRRASEPRYLALTLAEARTAEGLARQPIALGDFLAHHLGGRGELDFKAAINLVLKLYHAGFLAAATPEMSARLAEFTKTGEGAASGRLLRWVAALLDYELVRFERARVHAIPRFLGKLLVSTPGVVLLGLLPVFFAVVGVTFSDTTAAALITPDLARPEVLVAKLFFALSIASTGLGIVQLLLLAGAASAPEPMLGGSLRLSGFVTLRFAVADDEAMILPTGAMRRYYLASIFLPWAFAGLTFPVSTIVSAAFALCGVFTLCPLVRSPLVRFGEASLATLGLLEQAQSYLREGLFKEGEARVDGVRQAWLASFAGVALVWLYGTSLLFSDLLVDALPPLIETLLETRRKPLSGVAAGLLIGVMSLGLAVPALRLLAIPLQNLAALARLPLHRARKGLSSFYDKKLPPTAALLGFLREIPILAGLGDGELMRLVASLNFRRFPARTAIVRRGDPGEEFFILAEGQAQVIVTDASSGAEQVVDVLNPGDSFGEIALLEQGKRTATIRSLTDVKTLVLGRKAFDALFPAQSEERIRLTRFIRQVKLVLESEALSHLAPRQIRELLARVETVTFAEGAFLMQEGTDGDCAYLIESGDVQVVHGSREVANLDRGALVGAISLIKDVKRTASVRARSEVKALKIDKPIFLSMCLSNMFVALLVADLSDRQIAATREAG